MKPEEKSPDLPKIPDPGTPEGRLRLHNEWRRGSIETEQIEWLKPETVGEAIDAVLADLAARDVLIGELRRDAELIRQIHASTDGGAIIMEGRRGMISDVLARLLARLPEDAGAELERLREAHRRCDEIRVREIESVQRLTTECDALRAKLASAEAMRDHHAACCRDYLARNQQLEQRAEAAEARLRAVTEALTMADPYVPHNGCHTRQLVDATLASARSGDLPPHPDKIQLRCLLARIHRDGGHYTEKYGIAESCAEADRKVVEMLAAIDAARAQEGGAK